MIRLLSRVLVCAALSATFAAHAQTDKATAESLMRKSGLWNQIGEIGPQIGPAIRAGAAKGAAPSDPAAVDLVARAGTDAFAPERMRASALKKMQQGLQPDKLPALRRWYDSANGRKITQLEEAAAKRGPTGQQAYVEEGVAIYRKATAARQKLLDELVAATNAPNAMVDATFAIALAVTEGVAKAKPQQTGPTVADVKTILDNQRPQLVQAFTAMTTASFANAYSSLGDADLKRYVDFLKSPAGQHFHAVGLGSLDAALADSGRDFGSRLPAIPVAAASAPATPPPASAVPAAPPAPSAPAASMPAPVLAPPTRS